MKQTSIEWLQEKLDGYDFNNHHMEVNIVISLPKYIELLNQAKAMFEEQIIEAHDEARTYVLKNVWKHDDGKRYYQETYGK